MSLFSRAKVWIYQDSLYSADLNGEIDNVIAHMTPAYVVGWEANVSQMQQIENPGSPGSENLGTSLSDDIMQLRYMLNQIIGGSQWYSPIPISLTGLNAVANVGGVVNSRITSGRVSSFNQPLFLKAAGAAKTVTLKAGGPNPNFLYFVESIQYTLTSDVVSPSLTSAPSSQNTCVIITNGISLSDTQFTIGTVGSNITSLVGQWAAFKVGSEVFIGFVKTSSLITRLVRGVCFDSTDSNIPAATSGASPTATLLKLAYMFLNSTGTLTASYNSPVYSFTAPVSPSSGDYWYDYTTQKWKSYNGVTFVDALSVFVGLAISDATNCLYSKSLDFYRPFSNLNSMILSIVDNNNIDTGESGIGVSVYGTLFSRWFSSDLVWNTVSSLDTGVTISASSVYYCYVTDQGLPIISNLFPLDRRFDLLGWYHPAKPWRCVGAFCTDGSSNISQITQSPNRQVSALSTGIFNTGSTTPVDVTNATVTILTSGGTVFVQLIPDAGPSTDCYIEASSASGGGPIARYTVLRDGNAIISQVPTQTFQLGQSVANSSVQVPPGVLTFEDNPPPGIHTYKLQAQTGFASQAAIVVNCRLQAIERIDAPWPPK